ncbi:GNAT family N-acetyltransferase [Streptomyces sp. NPDC086835]|uniref:GNAT family N-acetyltransferase n=1 Tax=Streptomyces sp. NPDC086835 TaxID=3365761 RepID=UPI0038101CFB
MRVFLETGRLTLRAFTDVDAGEVRGIIDDAEVMRYINGGRPSAPGEVERELMPRLLHRYRCFGGPGFWVAEERGSGRFLGWFVFRPESEDSSREVELGYRLGRAAWGRGLATEGSLALIHKGFSELGVERVTANTMTVNTRSRRVMEKVGLRFVRTFFEEWPEQIEGSELGDVEYALTREEWERSRTSSH